MAYASRTGTRRNLAALRRAGWRLLVSATGVWRTEGFPYALDNGAWTSHTQGKPFDADLFRRLVAQLGSEADWIAVPDIVAGYYALNKPDPDRCECDRCVANFAPEPPETEGGK